MPLNGPLNGEMNPWEITMATVGDYGPRNDDLYQGANQIQRELIDWANKYLQ